MASFNELSQFGEWREVAGGADDLFEAFAVPNRRAIRPRAPHPCKQEEVD